MHTFRSPSGVDFTQTSWPAGLAVSAFPDPQTQPNPADNIETTKWVYDSGTGLLEFKIDDAGKAVTYTYTPDGKLNTRQWARHDANTVTTYTYDSDTGEMTAIDYPGSDTPDVTFTYTRLGRQATVQDGVGTRTFTYDGGATGKLHLLGEAIAGTGGFYSKTITRDYDAIGRDAGFHIGSEYDVNYYPATDGRFERITGPGLWAYGVEYARLANSDLIEHVRYKIDYSSVRADVLRAYEPNRDLVDYVQNRVGSNNLLLATYDYTNDELGRRTRVDHSGPAFMTYSYYAAHTYNARSELTGTQRHLAAPPYPLLSPGVYGYTYDHIGNRQTSGVDGSGRTYTANDLNQYDSITNPAEIPDYDDDGNLTQDGTFNYTWDAENRLMEVQTRIDWGQYSDAYETGDKHVYFTYDYMGP